MFNDDWLVIMTKPRMEAESEQQLRNQEFETYLPWWAEVKRRASGWQRVESAMFPRYLFIRPTREQQDLTTIRSTRGVSQLVRFGNQPALVKSALIESIRDLERSRFKPNDDLKPFKKGDAITVTDGPFKGVSAKVWGVANSRVVILFDLMGQTQRVTVDPSQLDIA